MKRKSGAPATKGALVEFKDEVILAIKGSESRMTARMDAFMSNALERGAPMESSPQKAP
ncbi:MAG: hypothetical protein KGL74_12850 [Elusimicrobia bacterium]|nr:hypothetical protein [Elusimicrobiota bacterium]